MEKYKRFRWKFSFIKASYSVTSRLLPCANWKRFTKRKHSFSSLKMSRKYLSSNFSRQFMNWTQFRVNKSADPRKKVPSDIFDYHLLMASNFRKKNKLKLNERWWLSNRARAHNLSSKNLRRFYFVLLMIVKVLLLFVWHHNSIQPGNSPKLLNPGWTFVSRKTSILDAGSKDKQTHRKLGTPKPNVKKFPNETNCKQKSICNDLTVLFLSQKIKQYVALYLSVIKSREKRRHFKCFFDSIAHICSIHSSGDLITSCVVTI